jgi:hypothetical protein
MTVALTTITFDCRDAAALAGFWSAATGQPVDDGATEAFASIGTPSADGGPAWTFNQVPEGKTAKNRVHLDLTAPDGDGDAEVDRLVGLGAKRVAEHDEGGARWTVLADPEGNEFCVV